MSVRKSHNVGKNHIKLVVDYYETAAVEEGLLPESVLTLHEQAFNRNPTPGKNSNPLDQSAELAVFTSSGAPGTGPREELFYDLMTPHYMPPPVHLSMLPPPPTQFYSSQAPPSPPPAAGAPAIAVGSGPSTLPSGLASSLATGGGDYGDHHHHNSGRDRSDSYRDRDHHQQRDRGYNNNNNNNRRDNYNNGGYDNNNNQYDRRNQGGGSGGGYNSGRGYRERYD